MRQRWRPWLAALALALVAWRLASRRMVPPPARLEMPEDDPRSADAAVLSARPLRGEGEAVLAAAGKFALLPAARVLESAGLPFAAAASTAGARSSPFALLLLDADSPDLSEEDLAAWRAWVSSGGVLVLQTPPGRGRWGELAGLARSVPSRARGRLDISETAFAGGPPPSPLELRIPLLGGGAKEGFWTFGLRPRPGAEVLAQFDDREPALLLRRLGRGRILSLGASFADLHMRPQAGRHFDAARGGPREAAADAWPALLAAWWSASPAPRARLRALPGDASALLLITHEVGRSGPAAPQLREFAAAEAALGARATWFVRADGGGTGQSGPSLDAPLSAALRELAAAGHEIASHGVCHGPDFDSLPLGAGERGERDYRPLLDGDRCRNASLLDEVRASRARLERACACRVEGFRSPLGLRHEGLDLALSAAGYAYDSSFSAADALGHRPFRLPVRRAFARESQVVALPFARLDDDSVSAPPARVLELLRELGRREAPLVWRLRPDPSPARLAALRGVLDRLPEGARLMAMREAARWWSARGKTRWGLSPEPAARGRRRSAVLSVDLPEGGAEGLSFEVSPRPARCVTLSAPPGASAACRKDLVLVSSPARGSLRLRLEFE